jgi:sn-glycerol 3-phosphate transport system permease protein
VTRPVIASFAVISFLSAWNQYTWPRAVITESRWETVQIGLKSLAAAKVEQNNIGFAAAIIAALPVLMLLIFLQRQLIRGLTAGAVKG